MKQLGVTPDVRGVTAGPAMMQLNQVSLRKVLQLKMFPGLSYLVVAASPRRGCLLERRRCWGGLGVAVGGVVIGATKREEVRTFCR